jgi:hypothetical protein
MKKSYENIYLNVSYENSMGLKKQRCDIPSGATQWWVCPKSTPSCELLESYSSCPKLKF